MRIVFFGTSHGKPETGRKCSSTLIEVGERRYFVDMGTQSIEGLIFRGLPPTSVRAVFVTHMHTDHTNGLLSFLASCSGAYLNPELSVLLPGDTEGTRAAIATWLACNDAKLYPFDFRHVEAGPVYDDGTLRVTAYRTAHIENSFAYLLEAEGKRVLFSGDLSHHPLEDFPKEVLEAPLDLAICECAHFFATEYLPLFRGNENLRRLCFNHYSLRFLRSVLEVKEELSAEREVLLATDGLEIRL